MPKLTEIFNKFEEIQDRLEKLDTDPSKNDEDRNEFERRSYEVYVNIQHITEEHGSKSGEQLQPTNASEHSKFTQQHEAASNKVATFFWSV
jgi:uncharacterized coiled-coil DUF342 family protein